MEADIIANIMGYLLRYVRLVVVRNFVDTGIYCSVVSNTVDI